MQVAALACLRSLDQRGEPLWRDQAVATADDRGDLVPVGLVIEPHADPTLMADIGRHEEPFRVRSDQYHLTASWGLTPERDAAVAAFLHGEDLVAHAKGRVAPCFFFYCLGEGQADRAQVGDGLFRHSATL